MKNNYYNHKKIYEKKKKEIDRHINKKANKHLLFNMLFNKE